MRTLFFRQKQIFQDLRALLAVICEWALVGNLGSSLRAAEGSSGSSTPRSRSSPTRAGSPAADANGNVRPVSADEIWDFVAHGITG
jgi:hypothetical protein